MNATKGKGRIIGAIVVATLVFSVFRRFKSVVPIGNWMADLGWSLTSIVIVWTLVDMLFTGFAVLILLPPILGMKDLRQRLPRFFRTNARAILLGILTFVVFGLLASAISLSMGIFVGDWRSMLSTPDLHPDPDVIGWGYFILALIPGIWEELAFRGLIQTKLQKGFSDRIAILLSATFFGLFHFTNLLTESPGTAIGGVIMSFFFGLAWGVMTVRARSILPAMISHYLVDSMGQVFLNVNMSNPALGTAFFFLLTVAFPLVNIPLTMLLYRRKGGDEPEQEEQARIGAFAVGD